MYKLSNATLRNIDYVRASLRGWFFFFFLNVRLLVQGGDTVT